MSADDAKTHPAWLTHDGGGGASSASVGPHARASSVGRVGATYGGRNKVLATPRAACAAVLPRDGGMDNGLDGFARAPGNPFGMRGLSAGAAARPGEARPSSATAAYIPSATSARTHAPAAASLETMVRALPLAARESNVSSEVTDSVRGAWDAAGRGVGRSVGRDDRHTAFSLGTDALAAHPRAHAAGRARVHASLSPVATHARAAATTSVARMGDTDALCPSACACRPLLFAPASAPAVAAPVAAPARSAAVRDASVGSSVRDVRDVRTVRDAAADPGHCPPAQWVAPSAIPTAHRTSRPAAYIRTTRDCHVWLHSVRGARVCAVLAARAACGQLRVKPFRRSLPALTFDLMPCLADHPALQGVILLGWLRCGRILVSYNFDRTAARFEAQLWQAAVHDGARHALQVTCIARCPLFDGAVAEWMRPRRAPRGVDEEDAHVLRAHEAAGFDFTSVRLSVWEPPHPPAAHPAATPPLVFHAWRAANTAPAAAGVLQELEALGVLGDGLPAGRASHLPQQYFMTVCPPLPLPHVLPRILFPSTQGTAHARHVAPGRTTLPSADVVMLPAWHGAYTMSAPYVRPSPHGMTCTPLPHPRTDPRADAHAQAHALDCSLLRIGINTCAGARWFAFVVMPLGAPCPPAATLDAYRAPRLAAASVSAAPRPATRAGARAKGGAHPILVDVTHLYEACAEWPHDAPQDGSLLYHAARALHCSAQRGGDGPAPYTHGGYVGGGELGAEAGSDAGSDAGSEAGARVRGAPVHAARGSAVVSGTQRPRERDSQPPLVCDHTGVTLLSVTSFDGSACLQRVMAGGVTNFDLRILSAGASAAQRPPPSVLFTPRWGCDDQPAVNVGAEEEDLAARVLCIVDHALPAAASVTPTARAIETPAEVTTVAAASAAPTDGAAETPTTASTGSAPCTARTLPPALLDDLSLVGAPTVRTQVLLRISPHVDGAVASTRASASAGAVPPTPSAAEAAGGVQVVRVQKLPPAMQPAFDTPRRTACDVATRVAAAARAASMPPSWLRAPYSCDLPRELNNDAVLARTSLPHLAHPLLPLALMS